MTQKILDNTRVSKFLAAHDLTPDTVVRTIDGEIKRVTINGKTLMWTVHYVWWVEDTMNEWATGLGFKRNDGRRANENAFLSGHTQEEFDVWLAAKYGDKINV